MGCRVIRRNFSKDVSTHFGRVLAVIAAACLLLAGCAPTRVGYDMAPTLTLYRIATFVTLDEDQTFLVTQRLQSLHGWHRRTQLAEYARLLEEVDARLHERLDALTVGLWRRRVLAWWPALAERIAPVVAEVVVTFDREQLAQLRRNIADGDRRARERMMPQDAERFLQERVKRLTERAEAFFGPLEAAQRDRVRELAAALPRTEAIWLAERQARNARLYGAIERIARDAPPPARAQQLVAEVLADFWTPRDPEHARTLAAASAAADAAYAELFNLASPAQRAVMRERLRGWIADARELSAR